jgi:polyhydroxybutyrate depolymerase
MSHRLACDRADLLAAIATVAGNTWKDTSRCQPSAPVGVLQVHGTIDNVYGGGSTFGGFGPLVGPPYPSAQESVASWATKNGCSSMRTGMPGSLDLVMAIIGNETEREEHRGCRANGAAELWTIWGGSHFPTVVPSFADQLYTWLLAHSKP